MKRRILPDPLQGAKKHYGVFIEETRQLVFVVEASDIEEALLRMKAVLPLFEIAYEDGINIVEMMSCPVGAASFLDAFFLGTKLGAVIDSVVPSTDTRH